MVLYETERLIIRQWQKKDYRDLFEYASDVKVTKYLHFKTYKNIGTAKERIASLLDGYKDGKIANEYAIMTKDSKKVIGCVNIAAYFPQAGGIARIGYTLNSNFQGKGYATEAVRGLINYLMVNNIAKRVEAVHDVDNEKSGNVLKHVGMKFEGILRKRGENNFHSRYDQAQYSILWEDMD